MACSMDSLKGGSFPWHGKLNFLTSAASLSGRQNREAGTISQSSQPNGRNAAPPFPATQAPSPGPLGDIISLFFRSEPPEFLVNFLEEITPDVNKESRIP